jgi:hypothetical protein
VGELRGAFQHLADAQHHFLVERAADDLETER